MVTTWDILGAIGAASGVPALGWQMYTWHASGPKIQVESAHVYSTGGSQLGAHHFSVTAVNRGRAKTTITGWGLRLPDHSNLVVMQQLRFSTQLPFEVSPNSSASFYVEGKEVVDLCGQRQVKVADLRPWVRLATGQEVIGPGLPLKD